MLILLLCILADTDTLLLLLIRILTDSPSPDLDSFLLLLSPSSVCVLSPHFHLSLVRTSGTSDSCRHRRHQQWLGTVVKVMGRKCGSHHNHII